MKIAPCLTKRFNHQAVPPYAAALKFPNKEGDLYVS